MLSPNRHCLIPFTIITIVQEFNYMVDVKLTCEQNYTTGSYSFPGRAGCERGYGPVIKNRDMCLGAISWLDAKLE